ENCRTQAKQPSVQRRMVIVGERGMLAPHPVICLVHEDAGKNPLRELDRKKNDARDLDEPERQAFESARGLQPIPRTVLRLMPRVVCTGHPATLSSVDIHVSGAV